QLARGLEVHGAESVLQGHRAGTIDRGCMGHSAVHVARRRTTPKELPDAVREAVARTVQATVGSAERARDTVDDLVRGSRRAVAEAVDERRPATHEDIR